MNAAAPHGPVRPRWALEDLTVESLQLLWLADELEELDTGNDSPEIYHAKVREITEKYGNFSCADWLFVMPTLHACSDYRRTRLAIEVAAMALRVQAFSLQKRKLL